MLVGRCLRFYCFSKKDIISVIIFRVLFQARQTTNALGTTITCEWHICSGFPNPVPTPPHKKKKAKKQTEEEGESKSGGVEEYCQMRLLHIALLEYNSRCHSVQSQP